MIKKIFILCIASTAFLIYAPTDSIVARGRIPRIDPTGTRYLEYRVTTAKHTYYAQYMPTESGETNLYYGTRELITEDGIKKEVELIDPYTDPKDGIPPCIQTELNVLMQSTTAKDREWIRHRSKNRIEYESKSEL